MDPIEAKLVSDILTCGWHMITVPADDRGPGFTYSIGLFKSYGHPEVIVFGLPNQVRQHVLGTIARLVKTGHSFEDRARTLDVLDGYQCAFRAVRREYYQDHLGYAMWYYRVEGVDSFPALQCVWPDRAGSLPWDASCEASIRALQPPLYEPPV